MRASSDDRSNRSMKWRTIGWEPLDSTPSRSDATRRPGRRTPRRSAGPGDRGAAGKRRTTLPVRGVDQEPAVKAVGHHLRGVDGQVETDHRAQDADVPHQLGPFGSDRLEVAAEPFADRATDRVREGRPARSSRPSPGPRVGDRVAAEGGGVHPGFENRREVGRRESISTPAATPPARALKRRVRMSGVIGVCW